MRQFRFTSLKDARAFIKGYQPWHTGKVAYGHRETAEMAALELNAKKGRNLEAYQCKTCGYWHLGGRKQ